MASREKRPLAPSKTKQKANESNSSSPTSNNNNNSSSENSTPNSSGSGKKTKQSVANNTKIHQLAKELLDAVVAENHLTHTIPRRKVLQTALKRKQKTKKTLIKVKPKVTWKRLAETKKTIIGKKSKAAIKAQIKSEPVENNLDHSQGTKKTSKKFFLLMFKLLFENCINVDFK